MPKEDSDRRLLELAALAHGYIDDTTSNSHDAGLHRGNRGEFYIADAHSGWWAWNPLADDGDAFRLAVKLQITPQPGEMKCGAQWWVRPAMIEMESVCELCGSDPYAATRRAIVRAAAEIGRQMLENAGGTNA